MAVAVRVYICHIDATIHARICAMNVWGQMSRSEIISEKRYGLGVRGRKGEGIRYYVLVQVSKQAAVFRAVTGLVYAAVCAKT